MSRRILVTVAVGLSLAACDRDPPAPQSTETAIAEPIKPIVPPPAPVPTATPSAAPRPKLDIAALDDRRDPDRVLRYYSAALRERDWAAASRVWGAGSGVTAATLKAAYDRADAPILEVGKGQQEGGAGSLYYEAPVVLRFGPDAPPERGTLTLRRANDVPGATREQLRWHIERAAIGVGQ